MTHGSTNMSGNEDVQLRTIRQRSLNGSAAVDLSRAGDEEVEGLPLVDNNGISQSKTTPTGYFQTRRVFTMGLIDVALLLANVTQLKSVLDSAESENRYYTVTLALIGCSIAFHLIGSTLLFAMHIIDKIVERKKESNQSLLKKERSDICKECFSETPTCLCSRMFGIDCAATFCVMVVTILNVFITAFFMADKKDKS